jgi:hypothetical protein
VIVDPDFFEHWRTRMVVDALGEDPMTPMYIMRIWAHCQSRRATRFDAMPAAGLKALCRYKGDAQALETALIDAGFIERDGKAINVMKWAEHNAKLISNWKNGSKGGRPKQTDEVADETEEEPNDNPNETQTKPNDNPLGTNPEPIREEERREDQNPTNPNGLVVASAAADLLDSPEPGVEPCPHQKIIALYHEVLPMCPRVRDWTPARAAQLRARWNEDKKRQNPEFWKRLFEYVRTCDFLIGKTDKPFFADLEWISKSKNFTKIREGRYENRSAA